MFEKIRRRKRSFRKIDEVEKPPAPTTPVVQAANGSLSLLDLPDEILIIIINHLDDEGLSHFRLASRHMNDLTEPVVYEDIQILKGQTASRLAFLILTDIRRATWVKSLLVSTRYGDDEGLRTLPSQLGLLRNLRDLRLETPDCNAKTPEERISWVELQKGYEKVFAESSVMVEGSRRRLPFLQSCTLHLVDDSRELYSLTKYSAIFLHPTLKSLTLSCACTDFPDKLLKSFPEHESYQHTTALEYLHLEECDISAPSLAILLSFPQALKRLKISEGVRYDGFSRQSASRMHGNVRPQGLAKAISDTCGLVLEELSLSLGHSRNFRNSINQVGNHLDLTRLENLRHLELSITTSQMIIQNPDCDHSLYRRLPPNIEILRIFGMRMDRRLYAQATGREPIFPFSSCLIKDKANHGMPLLKHVVCSYEHCPGDTLIPMAELMNLLNHNAPITHRSAQVSRTKDQITELCEKQLSIYRAADVHVQVEIIELPPGFIPPYLYPETKPVSYIFWDSNRLTLGALAGLSTQRSISTDRSQSLSSWIEGGDNDEEDEENADHDDDTDDDDGSDSDSLPEAVNLQHPNPAWQHMADDWNAI